MIYILYLYLFTSTVDQSIKEYFPEIVYFKVVFATILFIDILFNKLEYLKISQKNHPSEIIKLIGFIVVVSIISFMANDGPNSGSVISATQFIISIFRPITVFFWVVTSDVKSRIQKFTINLLFFWIFAQIPFFVIGIMEKGFGYFGDPAVGTNMNGDAFCLGLIFWLGTVYSFFTGLQKKEKKYYFISLLCLILLAITSTKQIFLMLPISILIAMMMLNQISVKNFIKTTIFLVLAILAYSFAEVNFMGKSKEVDTNIGEILETSEKFNGYYQLFYILPSDLKYPFLGAGPGQFASFSAIQQETPLALRYITRYMELIPVGQRGMLTDRSSGIIAFYGELGILGLFLIYFIYMKIILLIRKDYNYFEDSRDKSISALLLATGVVIFSQSVFYNIFETNQFMLNVFWVLSGSILGKKVDKINS